MKILIVDDEMPARKQVENLLKEYSKGIPEIQEARSGEEALEKLKAESFDAVFLDIHLQDLTGLEVAREMVQNKLPTKIVFVTAFDQYAIEAFDCFAVNYLLKPLEEERFQRTLQRIEAELGSEGKRLKGKPHNPLASVEALLQKHLEKEHRAQKITLEKEDRLYVFDPLEILFIETEERSTKVTTAKGEFFSSQSLRDWESQLPEELFFRSHRSFLVNLEEIEEVIYWFNHALQLKIRGIDHTKVPISRTNTKAFKKRMGIQN